MEQKIKNVKKTSFFSIVGIAILIFSAMSICALLGYRFVRFIPEEKNTAEVVIPTDNNDSISKTKNSLQPNEASLTPTNLTNQDIEVPEDTNDYLVILENGTVKLYTITDRGEHIYTKNLDISPNSLMPEDIAQLDEGIILDSEDDLASLIEDYTS